jgi:hypothetical protein
LVSRVKLNQVDAPIVSTDLRTQFFEILADIDAIKVASVRWTKNYSHKDFLEFARTAEKNRRERSLSAKHSTGETAKTLRFKME